MPETAELNDLSDLRAPWCLRVAVTLRVAERIAAGVTGISELAAASNCDQEALHSVLGHLVSKGVFEEPSPGRFALNDAARRLMEPSSRLGLDLEGIGGRMSYAWGTLLTYVRTGTTAYHEAFGMSFWDDLQAHAEIGASFDALMGPPGHGTPNADLELAGDWNRVRTVVDVGGGTGAMLAEVLKAHPAIKGTLLDLPATVARSAGILEAAGVADRVTLVGQSFFDPLPAGADLYILKGVLNDWPEAETVRILRRCAEAARPDGAIVILGGVMPDDAPRHRTIAPDMLVAGGKTNTLSEFRELARQAALEVVSAGSHASGGFVVECRPATAA